MNFKQFWKNLVEEEYLIKSDEKALTEQELVKATRYIAMQERKKVKADSVITGLQKLIPKLHERWRAERVYWTEVKRIQTAVVQEVGEDLELEEYRVLLSPDACDVCREKTQGGKKVFHQGDLTKDGYGHVPPFHPHCYCTIIPK